MTPVKYFTCGLALLSVYTVGVQGLGCPSGWVEYKDECYQIKTFPPRHYRGAQKTCEGQDTSLALLRTREAQLAMSAHIRTRSRCFIRTQQNHEASTCSTLANKDGIVDENADCDAVLCFICQKPRETVTIDEGCSLRPDQFSAVQAVFTSADKCYYVSAGKSTWTAAKKECQLLSGSLATVSDKDRHSLIKGKLTYQISEIWMGLHKDNAGKYTWLSGEPVEYLPWDRSHTGAESQLCVSMKHSHYVHSHANLHASSCKKHLPFLCESPRGIETPGLANQPVAMKLQDCPSGWKTFGDFCYKLPSGSSDIFQEAERRCRKEGGHLPSLHSTEERDFLKQEVYRHYAYYWIGMRKHSTTKKFSWTDESPFDFSEWKSGQPESDSTQSQCARITKKTMEWDAMPCSGKYVFGCKKKREVELVTTTTTATTTTISTQTTQETTEELQTTQQTTKPPSTTPTTTQQQETTQETTTEQQETTTEQQETTQETTKEQQETTQETTTEQQETTTEQQETTQETTTEQQGTTTEQQETTQETTTEQQETTQETTTDQQETTQETTTEQQETTQETTTVQQVTTLETTTEQQNTTQETTTEQQNTTLETTTEQQNTTQETTTEQQETTQETTTEQQNTTQETTLEQQNTTQETTPEQQNTTQETTTEQQNTTQEIIPEQQNTTQETTTEQQNTTQETTPEQQNTTQETTTEQQNTTQETTPEQQETSLKTTTEQQEIIKQPNTTLQATEKQHTTPQTTADVMKYTVSESKNSSGISTTSISPDIACQDKTTPGCSQSEKSVSGNRISQVQATGALLGAMAALVLVVIIVVAILHHRRQPQMDPIWRPCRLRGAKQKHTFEQEEEPADHSVPPDGAEQSGWCGAAQHYGGQQGRRAFLPRAGLRAFRDVTDPGTGEGDGEESLQMSDNEVLVTPGRSRLARRNMGRSPTPPMAIATMWDNPIDAFENPTFSA